MKSSITKYWFMWFITALFYALDYFQHTAPSVLIQPIAASLQTDIISIGNIMSIYFPIYALCQIPAGYMLDRYELKYVLCSACILISIGLLAMDTATISFLIVGRVAVAVGSAFAFLGSLKAASVWLPARFFGLAVGLTNTIGVMGGLLGQPLFNAFILQYDWRHSLLFISVIGLIIASCLMLFLENKPKKDHPPASPPSIRQLLSTIQPQTWYIAIYAGIMVGTVVNAFSELYDVVFLEQALNIHSQQAANISGLIFIGIAVGGPCHGIIARYIKNIRNWMLLCCLLTIITFTTTIFSALLIQSYYLIYLLYFSVGFFVSSMLLGFHIAKYQQPTANHATAFALINMVIGLCGWFFQFILGGAINWFKAELGGPMNTAVFINAFWFILIPLFISFFFCYKINLNLPKDNQVES